MADTERATSGQVATPSGAVFPEMSKPKVSDTFIRSLSKDGVSHATIKSIERDNARRTAERT